LDVYSHKLVNYRTNT